MVLITIVTGAYKPTYNWGASHCIYNHPILLCLYHLFNTDAHMPRRPRDPATRPSALRAVPWSGERRGLKRHPMLEKCHSKQVTWEAQD
jgi:hypothetical protein